MNFWVSGEINKPIFLRKANENNGVDILSKSGPALRQTWFIGIWPKMDPFPKCLLNAVGETCVEWKASFIVTRWSGPFHLVGLTPVPGPYSCSNATPVLFQLWIHTQKSQKDHYLCKDKDDLFFTPVFQTPSSGHLAQCMTHCGMNEWRKEHVDS